MTSFYFKEKKAFWSPRRTGNLVESPFSKSESLRGWKRDKMLKEKENSLQLTKCFLYGANAKYLTLLTNNYKLQSGCVVPKKELEECSTKSSQNRHQGLKLHIFW